MGGNQRNEERIIQKVSIGLMDFLIVCYDFSTGNHKHLLLPDGHCAFNDIEIYNTLIIPYSFAILNKIFQSILFVAFLYYFHQFITISANAVFTSINRQLKRKFTRVAFAFGAAIGLSQFTWILGSLTGYRAQTNSTKPCSNILLLIFSNIRIIDDN